MKNRFLKYISCRFIEPYDGLQGRLTNQLIYSQLKNRLVMMTQKPSTTMAKWKYSGVLPLLLMAMLILSFREKENTRMPDSNESRIRAIDDNTEKPLFPGCEKVNEMEKANCSHQKLNEYVANNLKYPEELKSKKIEGKVYVKFVVTNNGFVASTRIQKSLHPAADQAALDVVNGMNEKVGKWTPGTKEGRPVTMDMVLPISFVLETSPK
jgi:TonB family protein